MDRQGYNGYPRGASGGGYPRNNYYDQDVGQQQHRYNNNVRGRHHGQRYNRPAANHQGGGGVGGGGGGAGAGMRQPMPPQQAQPQQHQMQAQYSQYHYYAPVAQLVQQQIQQAEFEAHQMMMARCAAGAAAAAQYTLSPTAQEFVPSSFMMPHVHDSGLNPQFMQQQHQESQMMLHHQQQQHQQHQQQGPPQQYYPQMPGNDYYEDDYNALSNSYEDEDTTLLQLHLFITDVTLQPELFDSKVVQMSEMIEHDINTKKIGSEVFIETIFQAGVLQQNFRYSGARLIDTLVEMGPTGEIFRNNLLEYIFKTLSIAKPVVGDKFQDKEARGTALFCAELFFQLELGYKIDVSNAYPDMGPALARLIQNLILSNEKENQKNGIQALKLCGASLDKLCEGSGAMDELFMECKNVELKDGTDDTIKFMLHRLPELRKTNWDYKPKAKVEQPQYCQYQEDVSQMPVMYGPDGQPLSAEEMGFLDAATSGSGAPTMDDEALEAYEQFLKETGQK